MWCACLGRPEASSGSWQPEARPGPRAGALVSRLASQANESLYQAVVSSKPQARLASQANESLYQAAPGRECARGTDETRT